MDISNLPNDVIKHIESFVDKRPPFADELLNFDFKIYEFSRYDLIELPDDLRHFGHEVVANYSLISHQRKKYLYNVQYNCMNETIYGYNVLKNDKIVKGEYSTLGLIMREDADKQGIPPQTFNCGQ